MKKIITLISFISITILNFGQLGNPSFENWESPLLTNSFTAAVPFQGTDYYICSNSTGGNFSYNELQDWSSTNQLTKSADIGNVELVSLSTTAVDGNYSIKIESKSLAITPHFLNCGGFVPLTLDNVAPGLIVNGSFKLNPSDLANEIITGGGLNSLNPFTYPGVGEPIDFIPKTISGQYNYSGATNGGTIDSFIVVSGLKKNGEIIGYCTERYASTSSFTPFSIEYTHLSCEIPDTIVTVISSSSLDFEIVDGEFIMNTSYTGVDGSVLYVDDIHLDTILPAEFPPILLNEDTAVLVDTDVTINILANDTFCDGNILAPILNYSGTEGTATINIDNDLEFEPNTGFEGTVSIPYYTCNIVPLCDTAILTITYEPLAICYTYNDNYSLVQNQTSTTDPKLNDDDCGSEITIIEGPVNGVLDFNFNGTINYAPNTDFVGVDSFTYSNCNDLVLDQCDTSTVYYSIVSGINEIGENLIKFYPNPAKNTLNILVDVYSDIEVNIFNTLGEKMTTETFNHSTIIDLSVFNNGIYFVEIETDGKKSVRKLQVIK